MSEQIRGAWFMSDVRGMFKDVGQCTRFQMRQLVDFEGADG